LTVHINFPDCWNHKTLDSPDHKSHLAYHLASGACPAGYPVPIPRVRVNVHYPTTGGPGVALASGGQYSGHADFFNPTELARPTCINGNAVTPRPNCAPGSNSTDRKRASTAGAAARALIGVGELKSMSLHGVRYADGRVVEHLIDRDRSARIASASRRCKIAADDDANLRTLEQPCAVVTVGGQHVDTRDDAAPPLLRTVEPLAVDRDRAMRRVRCTKAYGSRARPRTAHEQTRMERTLVPARQVAWSSTREVLAAIGSRRTHRDLIGSGRGSEIDAARMQRCQCRTARRSRGRGSAMIPPGNRLGAWRRARSARSSPTML
jgi:hypothetical protein